MQDKKQILKQFLQAFSDQDLDALMSFMTEDCLFYSASGLTGEGAVHQGSRQVREAFAAIYDIFPDATWSADTHFIEGDMAFSEWTFSGTHQGTKTVVRGCDKFIFEGDRIRVKDSFRKQIVK